MVCNEKIKSKLTTLVCFGLCKGLQVDEAVILGKENTDTARKINANEVKTEG